MTPRRSFYAARASAHRVCTVLTALTLVVTGAALADPYELEFQELAEGIFVAMRPDPVRSPVEGNVTVIINDRDVVVVDGSGAPLAAERVIAEIRRRTNLPVRYLVNTHWHGDHHLGNQVYASQYPGVEIISHRHTREDIASPAMDYVAEERETLPGRLVELKESLASGRRTDGTTLPGSSRERLVRLVEDLPFVIRELARMEITPPTAGFSERLTLHRGERTIDIRWLGRGNTRGDAVIHLPRERLIIAGDLVVAPIPFGFDSYPGDWIETLRCLLGFDFDRLVPGHGPVQTDWAYIQGLIELLESVVSQTRRLVDEGADLAAIRERIDLAESERRLTGGDSRLAGLFQIWFVEPIIHSAYREATGQPIIQGDGS